MNREVNYKLLRDLDDKEKKLFSQIMKLSNMSSIVEFDPRRMDYSDDDLMELFEIQKGQIENGNDSRIMIKKVKKTAKLMLANELIDKDEYDELVADL